MYKLMIVEDEPLTRAAIMKIIDFTAFGFEVVAVCEDGLEALDQYFRLLPDLVITDICMPFLSGLELAGKISQAGLGTRVIILTGYDDFDYARKAITNQVSDYILKPLTSKEFSEVLVQAQKALDQQKQYQNQIHAAQRELFVISPLIRDQLMNRLIQGTVEPDSILKELNSFGLELNRGYYQISLVMINNMNDALHQLNVNTELLQFMLTNIMSELTDEMPGFIAFSLLDGKMAVVGSGDQKDTLNKDLLDLCHQISETIEKTLGIYITIGVSGSVSTLNQLKEVYNEATKCLLYKPLLPATTIISSCDIKQRSLEFDYPKFQSDLLLQIKLQDEEKIQTIIENMLHTLKLSGISKAEMTQECSQIVTNIQVVLQGETGINQPVPVIHFAPEDLKSDYWQRIKEWLTLFAHDCVEFLRTSRHGTVKRLSVMATEYIKEHYADSHLSLMEVCNHLSVSISYFGIFFKDSVGKTFIEYLTEIRMAKAKDLLANTDLMLYTVADRVGYENPAYFTVAFKKNTGMNPKEYRKAFGRKE